MPVNYDVEYPKLLRRAQNAERELAAVTALAADTQRDVDRLRAENAELKRLGYLAGIAGASPAQLEELRVLCKPQEGA